ncbi:MAG: malto-oligosyltrehalose synthase [Chloroflexia bacterium]|nr:malto-oligosyltrehalose synthase [Chloroflexia bacterium]
MSAEPPRATYRLQLNHEFTFRDATAIVPYLARFGVSHVYASPIFKAAPGSMHGYDVVDYGQLNPEIGTRADFDALVAALHDHAMGLILDFVPNHMGIGGGQNRWWLDVLENGRHSPYAAVFDIDWEPLKRELHGKVLLPILGDQYGVVLERGELTLACAEGAFTVHYWETPLPIAPATYPAVLRRALPAIEAELAEDDLDRLEFESIITALDRLPDVVAADRAAVHVRQREQIVAKHRLATLVARSAPTAAAIAAVVAGLNGDTGEPSAFDALDDLLEQQPYRLAFWRVAAEEINYRRFFAINTLAAIRQEEPEVFAATHAFLFELLADGSVDGVRIDHPDGLWDPAGYFRALQRGYLMALGRGRLTQLDDATWDDLRPALEQAADAALDRIAAASRHWPLYVLAEKILEHGETLPENWMVAGTVGYEFARSTTGLFVDHDRRRALDQVYDRFTGERIRFPELVYQMKYGQLRDAFPSEVNVLTNALNRISEHNRRSRDFTANDLRDALRQTCACFPVYRTYTVPDSEGVAERDRRYIEQSITLAKRRTPRRDISVYDFLADVLLLQVGDTPGDDGAGVARHTRFAMRFQQLTGPVMAKGLEDTAFYIFNRLTSLNEVGGDPNHFGTTVEEFHRLNRARQRHWPRAMLTSSTHDTKRSEDVRARINVLSESPSEWRAALNRWTRLNRRHRTRVEGALAPHKNDTWLIYQTLLGTWPLTPDASAHAEYVVRIQDYAFKAIREAAQRTNWLNPSEEYEAALTRFIAGILDPRRGGPFRDDFAAFHASHVDAGLVNALSQQLLKLTALGVPDIYQGTELWDDSLVDPDNRRPVDFDHRTAILRDLERTDLSPDHATALFTERFDGRLKLFVTQRTLATRRDCPSLFADGDYRELNVLGEHADRVVAFARRHGDQEALVVVPRLVAGIMAGDPARILEPATWGDTRVQVDDIGGMFRDIFTGTRHQPDAGDGEKATVVVGNLFATLPLTLLVREAQGESFP